MNDDSSHGVPPVELLVNRGRRAPPTAVQHHLHLIRWHVSTPPPSRPRSAKTWRSSTARAVARPAPVRVTARSTRSRWTPLGNFGVYSDNLIEVIKREADRTAPGKSGDSSPDSSAPNQEKYYTV